MFKFQDRQEVANKVEMEGLGYFILDYARADNMPDEELKQAFADAKEALLKFENMLLESNC